MAFFVNRRNTFLILFSLLSFYFLQLGNRPFATPDEARYVEIPREMVASGDYLTPRLNGVKYFEKPPLFYWSEAAFLKYVGTSETAMRLPVALFAVLGLLATFFFCRRWFDEKSALSATLVLGTSVLYFSLGRLIILDMPMSVIVTLSLFSFYNAFYTPLENCWRRYWFYLFSLSCALGVLTKGIMSLAIAGPVIVMWLTVTRNWGNLRPVYSPTSILVFLAIAAPWHIWVAYENPEFLHKYFIVEHVLRYTTDVHLRTKPFWFFVPVVLLGLFPWIFFLPRALKEAFKRLSALDVFLLLWGGWVFVFFSLSNSKLIPYVLPLFTPLAILIGRLLCGDFSVRIERIAVFIFLTFIFPLAIMSLHFFTDVLVDKETLIPYVYALAGVFVIGGGAALLLKQSMIRVLLAIAIGTLVLLVQAAPEGQRPSIKEFAQYIRQHRQPGDRVMSFMAYYQDLPVYTQQIVAVIEAKGELEFGTLVEDTTPWMVPIDRFEQFWKEAGNIWGVARKSEIQRYQASHPWFHPIIIREASGNVLIRK